MSTKTFSTLSVAEVYSGICLQQPCGMHEVMDHLYPGIMTLGTAMMQPAASKYLGTYLPELAALGMPAEGGHEAYAVLVVEKLGSTLEVPGPHDVNKSTVDDAFEQLGSRG